MENAVAALHNTPALPATQGGAASASQFDALFEKVDSQMRSLERAPVAAAGAIASDFPDLDDVRSVRAALLSYKSVYEQKMALDDTINQSKQAGGQPSVTEAQLADQRKQHRHASNQARLDLMQVSQQLSSKSTAFFRSDRSNEQPTARAAILAARGPIHPLLGKTALPTAITADLHRLRILGMEAQPPEHKATLCRLLERLGNQEAMTITSPEAQRHMFSHLYAMMNRELVKDTPQNLESMLSFLLPQASKHPYTRLAQLQLLLAALRGLNPDVAARVNALLDVKIVNNLTLKSLLSRGENGDSSRNRFLMMANQLSEREQKLAVLKFTRGILEGIKLFATEHQRLQGEVSLHRSRMSPEQQRTEMLDSTAERQLNLEGKVRDTMAHNPNLTLVSALSLPSSTPKGVDMNCKIAQTPFNYITHDHSVVGVTGLSPDIEDSWISTTGDLRIEMYQALLDGHCAAVHVVSRAAGCGPKQEDNYENSSFFNRLFAIRGLDEAAMRLSLNGAKSSPFVASVKELGSGDCTPFSEDAGAPAIKRHEYEIRLVQHHPLPDQGDDGAQAEAVAKERTIRVLETFIDQDTSQHDPRWEKHCALRQAFLANAQQAQERKPLLTLSPPTYLGIDPEQAPAGTSRRDALEYLSRNFELLIGASETLSHEMATQLSPALQAEIAQFSKMQLREYVTREPTLSLQMIAADILWQNPESTLSSVVSALRVTAAPDALMNQEDLMLLKQIEEQRDSQRTTPPPDRNSIADRLLKKDR
ncbi:MAG: hypothetical protein ACRC7P_05630 [Enterovibrio sp.]